MSASAVVGFAVGVASFCIGEALGNLAWKTASGVRPFMPFTDPIEAVALNTQRDAIVKMSVPQGSENNASAA